MDHLLGVYMFLQVIGSQILNFHDSLTLKEKSQTFDPKEQFP